MRTAQTSLGESTSNSSDLVATHPLVQQLVKDQQALRSDMKVLMASQIRTESKLDNLVAGASGGYRSPTSQNRCHYCKKPGHYIDNCWKRQENLSGKKKTNLGATPDSGKTGPTQVHKAEAAVQSDKEDPAEN